MTAFVAVIAKGAYVPMPEMSGAESMLALGQELMARIGQRDQCMLDVARGIASFMQCQHLEKYQHQRIADMESDLHREKDTVK